VAVGFKAGLFNIGAEAGLCRSARLGLCRLYLHRSPWFLLLPFALIAATLAGALWGAIPGYLKAKRARMK